MANVVDGGGITVQRSFKKHAEQITRDDFDGGPVSLDEIETGLWLGNVTAAADVDTLKNHNITNILTIDSVPLLLQSPTINNKYVQASDVSKENLLGHFVECIEFIENSLENKKNVLVHCYFGVSRSATIVIAYIMKKYKITYTPAFERVKSKRRFVGPNPGFIQQLRLFAKMHWTIDPHHEQYKKYRLHLAADSVRKAKILPQSCMDIVKTDPGLTQTNPEPIVYRCRKCRRVVAAKSNIISHRKSSIVPPLSSAAVNDYNIDGEIEKLKITPTHHQPSDGSSENLEGAVGGGGSDGCEKLTVKQKQPIDFCTEMYFLEPLTWMDGILRQTQGKLNCPKCHCKLGNFSWIMGCQCPCGLHVSPAFYLVPAKIDLCRSVQNVQKTI